MKKHFVLTITFLFLFSFVHAQRKNKNPLLGTWESNGITIGDDFYPETDGTTWLSLYSQMFQESLFACSPNAQELKCDTVFTRTGNWTLTKSKQLILYNYHATPDGGIVSGGWDTLIVEALTDTSLILSSTEPKPGYILYFKRLPMQPMIADNFPAAFVPVVPAPDTTEQFDIYLVNSVDTSKKIKLETQINSLEISLEKNKTDTSYQTRIWYSGSINALTDTSAFIYYSQKNTYVHDDDYVVEETSMASTGFRGQYGELSLRSISTIKYSSPARTTWFGIGGGLTFFASLTTLIVAPLVSIKYSQGGFNSKRYFTWAGVGLCGLGVSIPLMILTKPKTYFITMKNKNVNEKYWYMEKQPIN
jgi:hypothetical protein